MRAEALASRNGSNRTARRGASAVDMTPNSLVQLQVLEDDLIAFKMWLLQRGVDPVIDARIEVTDGDRRSVRHAQRPGACRMELNAAGEPWRVSWASGLYIQECQGYRLVYRTHDEETC